MTRPLLELLLVAVAWLAVGTEAGKLLVDGNDPLGSPGELAWQAWLLMDSGSSAAHGDDGGVSGSTVPRRITPKSVFIAPAFSPQSLPACADGYRADPLGRCVKLVRVNQAAQLDFLLQRLNAMGAPMATAASSIRHRDDENPLRVRLSVATSASATTDAPTGPPSTGLPPKSPLEDKVPPPESTREPVRVSVVMADVSKRSGVESSSPSSVNDSAPIITVWSLENDTVHKTNHADEDATFSVEIPTSTQSPNPTDAPSDASESMPTEVLAPTEVKDSLPMLVISSDPTAAVTTTSPPELEESFGNNTQEGSGEEVEIIQTGKETETHIPQLTDELDFVEVDEGVGVSRTEHDTELDSKGGEDTVGSGSADDLIEHVQVVPMSEHMRHHLPLLEETEHHDPPFSPIGQNGDGFLDMSPHDTEHFHAGAAQFPGFVRFPPDSETSSVNLFRGNTVKFPTDHNQDFKHKPFTETQTERKQTYWWLPPGWRIDHQRHQPSLLRFWSRMPLTTDQSLLSQYSPSYYPPLPYQQRQENYNPQWSSMRRHMTA